MITYDEGTEQHCCYSISDPVKDEPYSKQIKSRLHLSNKLPINLLKFMIICSIYFFFVHYRQDTAHDKAGSLV